MVSGWQEKMEKTIAGRAEASKASFSPYAPSVRAFMSIMYEIAGKMLRKYIRIVVAKTRLRL